MSVVRSVPAAHKSDIHSTSARVGSLNNFTAKQKGSHAIKFGGRVSTCRFDDTNEGNYGGSWAFTGGFGLTQYSALSTDACRCRNRDSRRLRFERLAAVRRRSELTLEILSPMSAKLITVCSSRMIGALDRIITLSYGLRYETQTNAHSKYDFAPRVAVAWSPGAANSARPPKMVIRVGTGFFYNRFNESSTLADESIQRRQRIADCCY